MGDCEYPIIAGSTGDLALSVSDTEQVDGVPVRRFVKDVIRVGNYRMPNGNGIKVDAARLSHWVAETKRYMRNGNAVSIPKVHDTTGDPDLNRGWVEDLWVDGDTLRARVRMIGEDAIKAAARSYVSLFSPPKFTDGAGVKYEWPILHVALTTMPVVPGQDGFLPIAASMAGYERAVILAEPNDNELTAPQDVRAAYRDGLRRHENGESGDGLEPITVRMAKAFADGEPVTKEWAKKGNRWWGRNERFAEAEPGTPAYAAAQLWGGRNWFAAKLKLFESENEEASMGTYLKAVMSVAMGDRDKEEVMASMGDKAEAMAQVMAGEACPDASDIAAMAEALGMPEAMLSAAAAADGCEMAAETSNAEEGGEDTEALAASLANVTEERDALKQAVDAYKAEKSAVSLSNTERALSKRVLTSELDGLVAKGAITPAVAKKLAPMLSSDVMLSVADADGEPGFTAILSALAENKPIVTGETTGKQSVKLANDEQTKKAGDEMRGYAKSLIGK